MNFLPPLIIVYIIEKCIIQLALKIFLTIFANKKKSFEMLQQVPGRNTEHVSCNTHSHIYLFMGTDYIFLYLVLWFFFFLSRSGPPPPLLHTNVRALLCIYYTKRFTAAASTLCCAYANKRNRARKKTIAQKKKYLHNKQNNCARMRRWRLRSGCVVERTQRVLHHKVDCLRLANKKNSDGISKII